MRRRHLLMLMLQALELALRMLSLQLVLQLSLGIIRGSETKQVILGRARFTNKFETGCK